MFLKSIEVQGFKSFANKMTFEFQKGITCIVGPNGSGKSNVADAVRWVLGEQSAKQLRAGKMEDVIFAGTASRKPLGFAWVAITLDNSDHSLPVDYDTVCVSRRVYRSGESEYRINGKNVRLKDIQELFFDTGIGKEGYSIIGQGQIDKILSGKPEDRRELCDEAAGIVKYKKRKELTEKNLAREEDNLSRVRDILLELEKQLGPLKEQADQAKVYLAKRDQLKKYDANMYLLSFARLKEESGQTREKLSIARSQLAGMKEEYEAVKARYAQVEGLLEDYEAKISRLSDACSQGAVKMQSLSGQMRLDEEKLSSLKKQAEQADKSRRTLLDQKEQEQQRRQELDARMNELQRESSTIKEKAAKTGETLDRIGDELRRLRREQEEYNAQILSSVNARSQYKSSLERYQTLQENARIRSAQLEGQLISLQSETSNENSLTDTFRKEKEETQDRLQAGRKKQQELRAAAASAASSMQDCRRQISEAQRKYHEYNASCRSLQGMMERYEGYAASVKAVMAQKDSNPGIIGVVADIIRVDKKYETAIETALGGAISNIVTREEQTARKMIEFLREGRRGRATFLPLTTIQPGRAPDRERVISEPGVIGTGSELIQVPKGYEILASYLLGRIFVVDEIGHAQALARKYRQSLNIVTLSGERINPGGSISGGAYRHSGNMLARRRQIQQFETLVRQQEEIIQSLQKDLAGLEEKQKNCSSLADQAGQEVSSLALTLNTVQLRLSQISDSQKDRAQTITGIKKELADLREQQQQLSSMVEETRKKEQGSSGRTDDLQQRKEAAAKELEELAAREEILSSQDGEIRVRAASVRKEIDFTRREQEECEKKIRTISESLAELDKSQKILSGQMTEVARKREETGRLCQQAGKSLEEDKKELELARSQKTAYGQQNSDFFRKREELADSISSMDREEVRLSSQLEKMDENRTALGNYMWEEYSLTFQTAKELEDEELRHLSVPVLKKKIAGVKEEIRSLGPVNVGAIEQYAEVSGRYKLLKQQHDDIVEASGKLGGIIRSLDQSMKKQFAEKFQEIQVQFQKVFEQLFGGGKGTLTLSDPDNLLESGIIITAQPPGKKLQNMMQLSGGEKALTAISLLFAIQALKPSPFCLLDEIEAALDDANVRRFAQYLHRLTKDTQFIVITHRRGTMNAADVLYGITMQEKGISSLVSVSLIENSLSS